MLIFQFPFPSSDFLPKRWVFNGDNVANGPTGTPAAAAVPKPTPESGEKKDEEKKGEEKKGEAKPEAPHLTIEQLEKELRDANNEIQKRYVILESFYRRYEKKEIQLSKAVAARLQKEVEQLQNDFKKEAKSGKLDEDTTAAYLDSSKELEELWARYATIGGKRLGEFVQYARRNMGEDVQEISDIVSSTIQSYNSLSLEEIINRLSTIVGKGFDLFSRLGVLKDYAMANVPGLKQASDVLGRAYKYGSDKFSAAAAAVAGAVKGEKKVELTEAEKNIEAQRKGLLDLNNVTINQSQTETSYLKFTIKIDKTDFPLSVHHSGKWVLNPKQEHVTKISHLGLPQYLSEHDENFIKIEEILLPNEKDKSDTNIKKIMMHFIVFQQAENKKNPGKPNDIVRMIAERWDSYKKSVKFNLRGKDSVLAALNAFGSDAQTIIEEIINTPISNFPSDQVPATPIPTAADNGISKLNEKPPEPRKKFNLKDVDINLENREGVFVNGIKIDHFGYLYKGETMIQNDSELDDSEKNVYNFIHQNASGILDIQKLFFPHYNQGMRDFLILALITQKQIDKNEQNLNAIGLIYTYFIQNKFDEKDDGDKSIFLKKIFSDLNAFYKSINVT